MRTTSTEPIKRPPFPREAVRDLLGITRALYRAELAAPSPDRGRLERLHQIGKEFRQALDLGGKYEADTMAGRAARGWADQATAALGEVVAESEMLRPMVEATAVKVRRRG